MRLLMTFLTMLAVGCTDPTANEAVEIPTELQLRIDNLPDNEYLVVSGKVMNLSGITEQSAIVSEHDPLPKVLLVEQCNVIKGELHSPLTIVFASSTDVMWSGSPKFKIGDKGTWILHLQKPEHLATFYPELASQSDLRFCLGEDEFVPKAYCSN